MYERFVLNWCKEYVVPKNNQFGGQRGCSTYHFLAETWDQITEHLEDSRAASVLTAIDYSKAFNRIEHLPLLQSFAKKGAPTQLLRLLASFLTRRTMSVKIGSTTSRPRPVNAGAPQGSVLGTYVFNVATDDLEDDLIDTTEEQDEYNIEEGDLAFLDTQELTGTLASTPNRPTQPPSSHLSPIGQRHDFVILSSTRNVPPQLSSRIEPTWRHRPMSVRKFVDDNVQIEKLHMKKQRTYVSGNIHFKNPRVVRSERMFKHIAARAHRKGLRVNGAKTNLLPISASNSYDARAHFYDAENTRIESTNELKALGFVFNGKGDVSTQVGRLCRKFRQKVWTLRHLRRNGFNETELLKVYKSHIRPTIEYSAPIYHPMLTGDQTTKIERLQYFALKNIYGFVYSHANLIEMSGLKTLQQRREEMTLKFAQKTSTNQRFKHWFPERRTGRRGRERTEFLEMPARTDRRRNSPIYYYRRILNTHRVDYDVRRK